TSRPVLTRHTVPKTVTRRFPAMLSTWTRTTALARRRRRPWNTCATDRRPFTYVSATNFPSHVERSLSRAPTHLSPTLCDPHHSGADHRVTPGAANPPRGAAPRSPGSSSATTKLRRSNATPTTGASGAGGVDAQSHPG